MGKNATLFLAGDIEAIVAIELVEDSIQVFFFPNDFVAHGQ